MSPSAALRLLAPILLLAFPAGAQPSRVACAPDNAGLTLPRGFCAQIVAESLGSPRHVTVAPNGDLFIAVAGKSGGVVALRDKNGDGIADERRTFGIGGGSGIAYQNGLLFFAADSFIVRWRVPR